jgi:hypothetical protein
MVVHDYDFFLFVVHGVINQVFGGQFSFWRVLIPAAILFFGEVSAASDIRQQRSRAEGIWKNSVESWNRNTSCTRFDEKNGELLSLCT